MNQLIDIGINLTNRKFQYDKDEVIKRAVENGVSQMILTGTSLRGSKESLQIAKKYPNTLFSTVGVHPHDAKSFNEETLSELKKLSEEPEVVAIGECGLDFNRDFSPRNVQEKVFETQLDLARQTNLPLFLHERDAHKRFVDIITSNHKDLITRSVVHCFTGTAEEVKEYVELGFYIGITGWICDERRGKELQKAIKHIPLDRLMVETDSPFLTPRDLKPRPKDGRNEPAFLPHIVSSISKYMGVSEVEVISHAIKNTQDFFSLI